MRVMVVDRCPRFMSLTVNRAAVTGELFIVNFCVILSWIFANIGDLASLAASWLGDGDNEAISGNQVGELPGSDKVAEFALRLNVDEDTAVS